MANLAFWHAVIHPITGFFRKRRGLRLLQSFPEIAQMRICDLGGSQHFWDKLGLPVRPENVIILNINPGETQAVSTVSAYSSIPVKIYDGKRVPAADKEFDLLICNSVLEHVPLEQRVSLAKEMARVAKGLFLQTPSWSFPVEPHFIMPFIHWFPKSVGYWLALVSPWRILSKPSKDNIHTYFYGTNLLSERELRELFPGAEIFSERFLGLTKAYLVTLRPDSARRKRQDLHLL